MNISVSKDAEIVEDVSKCIQTLTKAAVRICDCLANIGLCKNIKSF